MKAAISKLISAVLAGIMIGIGGTVYLSCENQYIGALAFGLGLFAVVTFRLYLYTGKVGYIVENKPAYILDVVIAFLGNAAGTFTAAWLISLTRISGAVSPKALAIAERKISDNPASSFILAAFCGILMFLAVESYKIHSKGEGAESGAGGVMSAAGVFLPVFVFILCGFNHSVADMFYIFSGGVKNIAGAFAYLITAVLGNALGCMLIPAARKCILKLNDGKQP